MISLFTRTLNNRALELNKSKSGHQVRAVRDERDEGQTGQLPSGRV